MYSVFDNEDQSFDKVKTLKSKTRIIKLKLAQTEPHKIQKINLNIKPKLQTTSTKMLINVMDLLLSWIYSGKVAFPEEHNICFEFLLLADEYFLEDLKRKCEESLEFHISDSSITDLLILSYKYKSIISQSFFEFCIQYFVDTFHKLELNHSGRRSNTKILKRKLRHVPKRLWWCTFLHVLLIWMRLWRLPNNMILR